MSQNELAIIFTSKEWYLGFSPTLRRYRHEIPPLPPEKMDVSPGTGGILKVTDVTERISSNFYIDGVIRKQQSRFLSNTV